MRLPLLSVILLGASLLSLPPPAFAGQFAGFSTSQPVQAQSFDGSLLHKVRSRHGSHRSSHHGGYHGHRSNAGAAAAGALFGITLGAILANQAAQHNRAVEWCMRRYRSYNPRTGTWIDYHGRIRHCP